MEASFSTTSPSHAEIAALAEKVYLDSGCVPGRDLQNWLLAEAQLKQQTRSSRSGGQGPAPAHEHGSRGEKVKQSNKNRPRSQELLVH